MPEQYPTVNSANSLPLSRLDFKGLCLDQHPAILPPTRPGMVGRIGRFDLVKLAGKGGMGMVYLASGSQGKKPLAIKILRPELAENPRSLAFFLKEARHGSRLNHPHILPVLEFSKEPPFLVMPYMERGSLSAWLKTKPALSEIQIAALARQIASAMTHAHKKGLIHRDLKPSNILLDAEGRAYVSDFGLSLSLFNDALIDAGSSSVEGTPNYMSPAMAAGEVEDTRCDIYSFGAVLYELLVGQPPYAGFKGSDVIIRIRKGPPRPILELNPRASPVLTRIAEKAMARQLSDRYAHMAYVEEDLSRVMAGETVTIHRGSSKLEPDLATGSDIGPEFGRKIIDHPRRLRFVLSAMVFAIGVTAMAMYLARSPLRITQTIDLPGSWGWNAGRLGVPRGNLDSDRPPKIFLPRENNLAVLSFSGELLAEFRPPIHSGEAMSFLGEVDMNNDHRLERLMGWRANSNAFLSVYNDNDYEIQRMSIPGSLYPRATSLLPGTSIAQCDLADLDLDGQPEILAQVVSGHTKNPRALVVLDSVSGIEKWRFNLAPNPHSLTVTDIDGDHRPEVLLGSYATGNTNRFPDGTDDLYCYLYCLDSAGQLLWRRETGGEFSSSYSAVVDSDQNQRKEILVFRKSTAEEYGDVKTRDYPQLSLFNPEGLLLQQFGDTNMDSPSWLVTDLDADRIPEVLLTDCAGNLYSLAPDLGLRKKTNVVPNRHTWVNLELWGAEDLNADGRKELILSSAEVEFISGTNPGILEDKANDRRYHNTQILVLDSDFNILAQSTISKRWERMSTISGYA
ncbi:MAG TPA: protein kinase [Candidatus Paceibacterota bacterium]|nr:protein kinase [Verrucomicrobiota bacterium]HRY51389.1 protein kinase [Candidatus Paceibacterota bacterium]HSA00118.1 protein kinase [Candidatus Paceibacterota bacterium]